MNGTCTSPYLKHCAKLRDRVIDDLMDDLIAVHERTPMQHPQRGLLHNSHILMLLQYFFVPFFELCFALYVAYIVFDLLAFGLFELVADE